MFGYGMILGAHQDPGPGYRDIPRVALPPSSVLIQGSVIAFPILGKLTLGFPERNVGDDFDI
jgi:hypothetical protein